MGLNRQELYNKRIQLDFGLPGGLTYYVDGKSTCLGQRRSEENAHEFCEKTSGWGTSNEGTGRCKFHGGSSLSIPLHGRYSIVAKGQLREHYEEFARDPRLLDLTPELAIQRVTLAQAAEKYQTTLDDKYLDNMLKTTEAIVRTVSAIERIQSQQILTVSAARLMMARAIDSVRELIRFWFPDITEDELSSKLEDFIIRWQKDVQGEIPS